MEGNKQKRKPNWTEDESLSLVRLVDDKKDIIRGKFGGAITHRMKKEAWVLISDEINSTFSNARTPQDCEKRWYNIQCKSQKEISIHKKLLNGTGKLFSFPKSINIQ